MAKKIEIETGRSGFGELDAEKYGKGKNTPGMPCPKCAEVYGEVRPMHLVLRNVPDDIEDKILGVVEQVCMCGNCHSVIKEKISRSELTDTEKRKLSVMEEYPEQPRDQFGWIKKIEE